MSDVKRLLWYIAFQKEKVHGCLVTVVNDLFSSYSDDDRQQIVDKIYENIK